MYEHRYGGMYVVELKSKFDEYHDYFPLWMEMDRVEFCGSFEGFEWV
jgi:hypothetical protein